MKAETAAYRAPIRRREATRFVLSPLFRSEIIKDPYHDGLAEFEGLIEKGFGGIVLLKHFSLKDPPQIVKDVVFASPILRSKEVVVPNALHQIYPGVTLIGRFLGIKIDPIVTENTVKHALTKGKSEPKLNEGSQEFVRDAIGYLKRGQLVVIAPEGQRRNNLESYSKNSIGVLLGVARLARANVALLTVDLRVAGAENEHWKRSGFNPFLKYEVRIGRCLTSDQVIEMAGGKLRDVDEKVILEEMRRTAAIPKPPIQGLAL